MAGQPVFRFAPSPTGLLHLGHALSALTDFELCRRFGGRFLLRIEDIDQTRCRPEFEAAIYEDLRWLGISWEEPVRRQSEHMADYRSALDYLATRGLIYPAFMGRAEVKAATESRDAPHDPDGTPLYPGDERELDPAEAERRIASGQPYALRLRMDRAVAAAGPLNWREQGSGPNGERGRITARPEAWGDVVLARKETPTSYHLSVVVDDALQGVTDVVRGQDLFHATSIHVLLQALLNIAPPVYHHHRLMMQTEGRKLSKTDHAQSLASLRASGASPARIRYMIGLP